MNPREKMFLKQQERLLINIFELVGGACVDSTGTSFWIDGKGISRYFSARSSRAGHMEAKSESIHNSELKAQATASIRDKTFHCEGGGILALLSGSQKQKCVEFIIAYQTISDYLDNLCDRSTSLDPQDFRMLHASMQDALTVGAELQNYYQSGKNRMTADICMNWLKRASVFSAPLSTMT